MQTFNHILAGTIAGVSGIVAGQPFDTIKVRLQTSQKGAYLGPVDCALKIARNEGALGFFKGMLPPIVANAPINALLFAVEHTAFKWLETGRAASWSEDVRHLLAGALSGLLQVSLSCPSELVKIQMQVQADASVATYKGPWHCARSIVATEGVFGLYRGFWLTACRDTPAFAIYFWMYDLCKNFFKKRRITEAAASHSAPGAITLSAPELMLSGGTAGLCSWMFLQPIDVLKSLYQSTLPSTPAADRSLLSIYRRNMRADGVKFLFRGMVPTCVRAFPTSAIIFVVYEWSIARLNYHTGIATA